LTFGGTDTVRDWMGTNDGIDRESGTYVAGTIGGAVNGALLGGGAAGELAQGGRFLGFATHFSKVTASVESIYGIGRSAYNVTSSHGTEWDSQALFFLCRLPRNSIQTRINGNDPAADSVRKKKWKLQLRCWL
jgi:hypothetical protein